MFTSPLIRLTFVVFIMYVTAKDVNYDGDYAGDGKSLSCSYDCASLQQSTNRSVDWQRKQLSSGDESPSLKSNEESKKEEVNVTKYGTQTGILPQNKTMATKVRFCGVRDYDEPSDNSTGIRVRRYTRNGKMWYKKRLKWTLRTPSRARELSEGIIRQELQAALNLWQKESALVFEEVHKDSSDVDIYVDFYTGDHGDGNSFDGRGGTLAHAYYPGDGIGGDMHFDDAENFAPHETTVEFVSNSLLIAAAHELGHSLGLSHSDVTESLMAPYYQTFPKDFNKLPADDRRGIQAIYGRPEGTTQSRTHPPRTTQPPVWTPRPTPRPPRPTRRPPGPRPTVMPTRPPGPRPTVMPTRPPGPRPIPPPKPEIPDSCSTDFDAVTMFRRDIYFFRGKFYWRMDRKGRLYDSGVPYKIHNLFQGLPIEVDHIDAAYENYHDHIVLISGSNYYELHGSLRYLETTGTLVSLGVNATRLNAAMVWGYNGRVYLFSERSYWRLGYDNRAELDYPRGIEVWRGLPSNYSGALTHKAKTYFFAGRIFWEFNVTAMRVSEHPSLVAPYWFSCPHRNLKKRVRYGFLNESTTNHSTRDLYLYFITLAVIYCIS